MVLDRDAAIIDELVEAVRTHVEHVSSRAERRVRVEDTVDSRVVSPQRVAHLVHLIIAAKSIWLVGGQVPTVRQRSG